MGATQSAPSSGVKHIVMFGVKDDTTAIQMDGLKRCLLGMPSQIKQMKSWEYGDDLKLPSGQNHPSGKNRAVTFSATFESEAAYEEYASHPTHIACINDFIKPIIVPGSRAAIQYRLG